MATSATTFCAAGAAFAVGVAATVTFVSLNAGGAPGTAGLTQAEAGSAPPSVADRPWSDPVKRAGTSTSSRQEAQAPLTFNVERADEQVRVEPPRHAGDEGTRDPSRPERAQATQAAEVRLKAKSEPAQADQVRAQQAHVDAIKVERNKAEQLRLQQPRTAALDAAPAEGSRIDLSSLRRSKVEQTRLPVMVEKVLPHKPAGVRLAAKPAESSRDNLAAERHASRLVTRTRDGRFAAAERYEETRQSFIPPHDRLPRTDAGERSRRLSSADSRGVMRWLGEPDERHRFADANQFDQTPQRQLASRGRLPLSGVPEPKRRFSSAEAGGVMGWLMEPADRL